MQRQVRQLIAAAALLGGCTTGPFAPIPARGTWASRTNEYFVVARVVEPPIAGQTNRIEIRIDAIGGFHFNDEYPHHFTIQPSSAVETPTMRLDAPAFVPTPCPADPAHRCRLVAAMPFSPRAGGSFTLEGELAFGACDAERCIIEKLPITLPVEARD